MNTRRKNCPVVRNVRGLRNHVKKWRQDNERIALVPTMGALHEGHLSLVRLAQQKADRVIVTIFVNPLQFGQTEDFGDYPRQEADDRAKISALGVDLLFAPTATEMYAPHFSTMVTVAGITDMLCGASRPYHFAGVATIVTKLLLQALPDIAIFGEKDYQQLLVIKRLTQDLNIPVKILGGATVREKDGLALSSRNTYLNKDERQQAPELYAVMRETAKTLKKGADVGKTMTAQKRKLKRAGFEIDYFEVRDGDTLAPVQKFPAKSARLFAAVYLGNTRLIDNIAVR